MNVAVDIFHALEHHAIANPERTVYAFASEKGEIEQSLTWQQLKEKVDTLTGYLRTRHQLQAGERVLLVYPPSIEFAVAFAACMRAGLIPVPVYPPNLARADHGMNVFNRISADSDARLILTNQAYATARDRKLAIAAQSPAPTLDKQGKVVRWDTSDHLQDGAYAPVYGPAAQLQDVALIQYTSGSTSMPKGVVITHGNLAHQLAFSRYQLGTDENSRMVLWVPQYHDLGLIGGILNALGGNASLTLFSPLAFIKRPALWFELIHRVRATHTAAPNFAFDLALSKTTPEQRAQWDLSSLRMVMSAAEPVRARTSQRFVEVFSQECRLDPAAYAPAYGLAEHTVGISANGGAIHRFKKSALEQQRQVVKCTADDADSIELVSSGHWPEDIQLAIVDPDRHTRCAEGQVGEIWVDSPSKAAGYWNLPEPSLNAFSAAISDENIPRYLRTGDLGFVHEGQLYICGRLKDLLILAGRNVYPQDIEDSIQLADEQIRPEGMAAFAIDVDAGGKTEEKLVVMAEVRQRRGNESGLAALAQKLQSIILEQHQLPCHAVVLVPIGSVLKTTSGKVRRQACRQLWLDGTLQQQALHILQAGAMPAVTSSRRPTQRQTALTEREALLQSIAARLLNLPDPDMLDVNVPLTEQGMGSLVAVEFCQEYESVSGEELSVARFFNFPAIRALALALEQSEDHAETLDALYRHQPGRTIRELHALRHYLQHNRYSRSGFRMGDWAVRPATPDDVAAIHQLDQQEYGWLGEGATDSPDFIAHQVATLNSGVTPWFWLLEKHHPDRIEIVGWYIMQPTQKSPSSITSWADATDSGRFTRTFDPAGPHLYLVAGGISRHYTKQAHRLMVLNALSLMRHHGFRHVFACLAMPGFGEAHVSYGISPEDYIQLTHRDGMPRDAFLSFFRELWAGEHLPLRLLRNGYPPDLRSGGHGVCACVQVNDHSSAIAAVFDKLVQQRAELFDDRSEPLPRTGAALA